MIIASKDPIIELSYSKLNVCLLLIWNMWFLGDFSIKIGFKYSPPKKICWPDKYWLLNTVSVFCFNRLPLAVKSWKETWTNNGNTFYLTSWDRPHDQSDEQRQISIQSQVISRQIKFQFIYLCFLLNQSLLFVLRIIVYEGNSFRLIKILDRSIIGGKTNLFSIV